MAKFQITVIEEIGKMTTYNFYDYLKAFEKYDSLVKDNKTDDIYLDEITGGRR